MNLSDDGVEFSQVIGGEHYGNTVTLGVTTDPDMVTPDAYLTRKCRTLLSFLSFSFENNNINLTTAISINHARLCFHLDVVCAQHGCILLCC